MFFVKIIIVELEEYMIEINMWMDLFKKVILERGYEYFESGKIKDIHWDSNTVYGKVKGTEEYNVSAEIDGENVGKLSCDCPYAKGQKKCKHMAALLFKVLGGDICIDDEYDDGNYDKMMINTMKIIYTNVTRNIITLLMMIIG